MDDLINLLGLDALGDIAQPRPIPTSRVRTTTRAVPVLVAEDLFLERTLGSDRNSSSPRPVNFCIPRDRRRKRRNGLFKDF